MAKHRYAGAPRRILLLWTAFVAAFSLIGLALVKIQVISAPTLAAQGLAVRTHQSQLPAQRGDIVDANGNVLATSVETKHIAVNQVAIKQAHVFGGEEDAEGNRTEIGIGPAAAAQVLAPILGQDEAELGGKMVGDSTYVYLAKDVPLPKWREIRALGIYGIEWENSYQRVYPNGALAASVIGTINSEGDGTSGLELVENDNLVGVPGEQAYEIGATGEVIPGGKSVVEAAKDGATVHTSLRMDLQYSVEEALNEAVKKYGADWGSVVIEEVSTGRILVLADSGNTEITAVPQTSRIAQYAVEPGSVGKIVTVTSALEHGTVTPTTPIDTPYQMTTDNGQQFRDSHEHPDYTRTVTGVLAESSNTGAIRIGQTVSDEQRYDLYQRLGFGETTGIELPGESGGILAHWENWDGAQRYTTMFGQGYALTQLQQANFMATIANGGVAQRPHLVDGITRADGTYEETKKEPPRRVVDPDVAHEVVKILESTMSDEIGTGASFAVEGYRIGAKTGTAEIIENGQYSGTATTVLGVVPVDQPTLAVSVLLYRPRTSIWASETAGPLFHNVVSEAVRSLGVPVSTTPPELYPTTP